MSEEMTPQAQRKRRFLLFIPLLTLPFITLTFWAFGGGKGTRSETERLATGFNVSLPEADFGSESSGDKMSYYEQAAADSAKFRHDNDQLPYDHYSNRDSDAKELQSPGSPDANEQKVYERLAVLNKSLNEPTHSSSYASAYQGRSGTGVSSADIDRLEQMMRMMNKPAEQDPEMQQLNGMLDKIMDIQNPARVRDALQEKSALRRGQVFAVSTGKKTDPISILDKLPTTGAAIKPTAGNGFYSLKENIPASDSPNTIRAAVHETQTLISGASIKLRLGTDIFINGQCIPSETFVFGQAVLSGERLNIIINSIRYQNSIFPVELVVSDMDGMEGIYVPGAISRDVAKNSADQGIQSLGLSTMDPSLAIQAAGVGIEAVKGFLSKKVKLIRVTIKAGYQVLLIDKKQKDQN